MKNVLGGKLLPCCVSPMTGYFRDGFCRTALDDQPVYHLICIEVTDQFLRFSREHGNDLSTPRPEMDFPGLMAGDRWCLNVLRWHEAWLAGMAPSVILESCHESALEHVQLAALKQHAIQKFH